MKKILFVCTGNTCRSPMAEAVFNDIARKKGLDAEAFSRGLLANGEAVSENAKAALSGLGINASEHISASVCRTDIENADYVIGITARHAGKLLSDYPSFAEKIYAFPKDIPDPFGADLTIYRECLCEICDGVEMIAKELFPDKEI